MSTDEDSISVSDDKLTITTSVIVDSGPEFIWDIWTKPELISQWWVPKGFTNTIDEMDVYPGGVWRLVIHGPDGVDYPNYAKYEEVYKPRRLVFSHQNTNESDLKTWHTIVTLVEESDGMTKVTLINRFDSEEEKSKHISEFRAIEGARQTFTRMVEFINDKE